MLSSETLDSGNEHASCIEVGVINGVEYIFTNKNGIRIFNSDNLQLIKAIKLNCANPTFLLWRSNVLFCGTTSTNPVALTINSLDYTHQESIDSSFYCQHDLSFDLNKKQEYFFSCDKTLNKNLKRFHRKRRRVWMLKGHSGSVYSTTCSRGFVAEVYSGCYDCVLQAHDLRICKRRRKKKLPKWGGICTILPFKKDRFAFLGLVSLKVALVALHDLSIVKRIIVNSPVYTMDLNHHRLVICGNINGFYSLTMEEIEKHLAK